MTKIPIIAIAALVWTAGFGATGTLASVVSHPLPAIPTITTVTLPAPVAQITQTSHVRERVIVLPTIEIVSAKLEH